MTTNGKRDADHTQQLLLTAARRRFAEGGYERTTVREIASAAGVNVALINRYFGSKEGLFEACMSGRDAQSETALDGPEASTLDAFVGQVVTYLYGKDESENRDLLLMLLRSSGDAEASRIRRDKLQSFANRLLAFETGGKKPTKAQQLRAQVAVSTILGVALLRLSSNLEPLTSADAEDLQAALVSVCHGLLPAAADASQR